MKPDDCTEYLNTPRQIYDDQQQLRWRWDQAEPFGATPANGNPASLGAFDFPLRFPGQYADAETGLSYNGFRDYWPEGGRYIEPDPLGAVTTWPEISPEGWNHLYAYTDSNALNFIDPLGLKGGASGGGAQFFFPPLPVPRQLELPGIPPPVSPQPAPNTAIPPSVPGPAGKIPRVDPEWRNDRYRDYREGHFERVCANWSCPNDSVICTPTNTSGGPRWAQGQSASVPGWSPSLAGCRCVSYTWVWVRGF